MALLKHPAGFYVDTEKLAQLAGTDLTPGFALVSIWSAQRDGTGLKDHKYYLTWAQVNKVIQGPIVSTMSSGRKQVGDKMWVGSCCYFHNEHTVPNEQNPALALELHCYRRECVVTPAQMALEQLRRRLDNDIY